MSFDNLAECQPELPAAFDIGIEQPPNIEFMEADRVFIKQMLIAKAGTYIPQHSHKYHHTSLLAVGSVRVWTDGKHLGDFVAPKPIFILAGVKHTFLALEDNTLIYCIHNLSRSDEVEVLDEHHLGEAA